MENMISLEDVMTGVPFEEDDIGLAIEEYADNHDIVSEYTINLESGDVVFEGYMKVFSPVKFGAEYSKDAKDVIKRFDNANGQRIFPALDKYMQGRGYNYIKNENQLRECIKKYVKSHPIGNFISGKGRRLKTKTAASYGHSLLLLLLSLFVTWVTFFADGENGFIVKYKDRVLMCHTYVPLIERNGYKGNKNGVDESGYPSALHGIYFNEDENKIKLIKVGRWRWFDVDGYDTDAKLKNDYIN